VLFRHGEPAAGRHSIHVKIFFENEFFEAKGRVIYAQPHLGMGATFDQIASYSVPV